MNIQIIVNGILQNTMKKIGIIASEDCYLHAKEVFEDNAFYLKVEFSNPLPDKLFKEFAKNVDVIYVIEENDQIMENHIKALGIECHGKDVFPKHGEMIPEVIRKAVFGEDVKIDEEAKKLMINRVSTFCAGYLHRGFFYTLGKKCDDFWRYWLLYTRIWCFL